MSELLSNEFSRLSLLKGGGALIVGFGAAGSLAGRAGAAESPFASAGPFNQSALDTWIAVHADDTVSIRTGQAETGQGTVTGLTQIAAEELDVDLSQVRFVLPDSNLTPDTKPQTGSAGVKDVGSQLRAAAASARQALLGLAATSLGVPVTALTVKSGVVSGGGRSIKYGELLGDKLFKAPLLAATLTPGQSPAKPVGQYSIVGTRVPRLDIPAKVAGSYVYVHNVKVPGMVHGRVVFPRGQAAYGFGTPVASVDERSIAHIPGAQVVRRGDFIGVVAAREFDAIQAAAALKVTWAEPPTLSGVGNLFANWRAQDSAGQAVAARAVAPASDFNYNINPDKVDAALASSAKTVSATYKYHYNGHLPIGPSCCVADVTPDGALIFSNTQSVYQSSAANYRYSTRTKVAEITGLPEQAVRVKYYEGSSVFGNSGYDEAALAAAVMSQAVGKPVRVQFMRWDEHGWDFYGTPQLMDIRGGLDASGKITGIDYTAFTFGYYTTHLVQQQTGKPVAPPTPGGVEHWGVIGSMYNLPAQRVTTKNVPLLNNQFRTSFLRAPLGPQTNFGYEQFIDELAYAAGMDPLEFRIKNVATANNPTFPWYFTDRWLGVLQAAAQGANWKPRVAASNLSKETVVRGRGISATPHSWTTAAVVSEIEVNKKTGKIVVAHLSIAMDAGLSINPALVENQMVGGALQGVSKTLHEQVSFDRKRVTSLDWVTHPILRFKDSPKVTATVVQRPDKVPGGVGETGTPPVPASIANAFFDATGVRLRESPMTPARVRGALQAAGVV